MKSSAPRQYQAVEPEHRLVARTLERQWEDALSAESALNADHERFMAEQPAILSAEQREAILRHPRSMACGPSMC